MERVPNEKMVEFLNSIIEQANTVRNAIEQGTINYPDGEVTGTNEIFNMLNDADDALDTIMGYYV